MPYTTRRTFLASALALGAAGAFGIQPAAQARDPLLARRAASKLKAIEPIRRNGRSRLRLSIAAYSYRDYLTGKLKPAMTLDDFVDLAASLELDAVEPTAYYFPQPVTPGYLAALKGRCTRLGLDVSGGAVGNNFCPADPAKLRAEIASVKQWVEHYSRLGAKTIRIFAGNVDRGDSLEKARARCIEAIGEACDYAGKHGIYLALENHGGITTTVEQLLELVKSIHHEWFGVNLDTAHFHTADPYADLAKIAPYAVNVQLKTEIQRGRKKEPADLPRLIGILREANYRGYVALEYEAPEDPKTAIPRYVEELRKLMG